MRQYNAVASLGALDMSLLCGACSRECYNEVHVGGERIQIFKLFCTIPGKH